MRDDRAYANSICSKFRQDFQYQAKSVLDWVAHLEHLQSILLEYDPVGAPIKSTMLRYFREGLTPSVLAELKYRDLELKSFNQMVKKAVNAKAKLTLRPCSSTKKMDQNCPRGNQPANSTVTKSQGSAIKDPRSEKPKVRGIELSGPQQSESSEKARKEKKKEQHQRDWEYRKGSTPAADGQAEPHQKKKKKYRSDKVPKDKSQVKCFNCSKLGYYANACPEPKTSFGLGNLLVGDWD